MDQNRLLIGGLLLGSFLLLALLGARRCGAVRSLVRSAPSCRPRADWAVATSPILSRSRATTSSPDLGREFNKMSGQLETKIEEVERKRGELEETIRRVGDALATGLDRDGVVALAVLRRGRRLRGRRRVAPCRSRGRSVRRGRRAPGRSTVTWS